MKLVSKWTPQDQIENNLFQLEKKSSDLSTVEQAFKNALDRK